MSEHNNDLRVVTYTSSFGWFGLLEIPSSVAAKSPAILSVLREDASATVSLKELASRVIGKAGSLSGLDFGRHGINLFNVANGTGVTTRVALPVRVNETLVARSGNVEFYRPSEQSLVRFEVDTVNKTLSDKPSLPGVKFLTDEAAYQASSLEFERSVQIGPNIYYLGSQGSFTAAVW